MLFLNLSRSSLKIGLLGMAKVVPPDCILTFATKRCEPLLCLSFPWLKQPSMSCHGRGQEPGVI